jgi:MYXO-CTERM domain-containing protein
VQSGGAVVADSLDVFQGIGTYVLNNGSIATQLTRFGKASPLVVQLPTSGTMIQNGGTHTTDSLVLGQGTGSSGTYIMNGGTLHAGAITVSAPLSGFGFPPPPPTYGNGRLEINSSSASVSVSEGLTFGPNSSYAAVPGTVIHFTGPGYFNNMSKDPSALAGLENTTLLFETGDASSLEAASTDLGPTLSGFVSNFALDKLQIGGADIAALALSDLSINHPDSFGILPADAVYVDTLIVGPGSSLDLNNINLYCLNLINNGEILSSGGGQLTVVPEPTVMLGLAGLMLLAARRRRHPDGQHLL